MSVLQMQYCLRALYILNRFEFNMMIEKGPVGIPRSIGRDSDISEVSRVGKCNYSHSLSLSLSRLNRPSTKPSLQTLFHLFYFYVVIPKEMPLNGIDVDRGATGALISIQGWTSCSSYYSFLLALQCAIIKLAKTMCTITLIICNI